MNTRKNVNPDYRNKKYDNSEYGNVTNLPGSDRQLFCDLFYLVFEKQTGGIFFFIH